MNKNAVYVREQPKKSIATIILVDKNFLPDKEVIHENIDKLGTFSDIIFVFSEKLGYKGIDLKKFCNLYNSCAYLVGEDVDNIINPLLISLKYGVHVFKAHAAYLITSTRKLLGVRIDDNMIGKINSVTIENIYKPVFVINRMSGADLKRIYYSEEEEDNSKNKSWWKKIWNSKDDVESRDRMWTTHYSESPIIYMKVPAINAILTGLEDSYIKTFTEDDLGYFFASVIYKQGIGNINVNIKDIKLEQ